MKSASAKAKGRARVCRRCGQDYTPSIPLQKVCNVCRTTCSGCGKSLTEKNWDSRGHKNRKQFRCKACVAAGVKRSWHSKSREYQRDYDLRRHYGISLAEYDKLYIDQRGRCAICDEAYGVLRVDHCHVSGKVRGLLCNGCNRGLGFFDDSAEKLYNAVRYLDGYQTS